MDKEQEQNQQQDKKSSPTNEDISRVDNESQGESISENTKVEEEQ